MRYLDYLKRFTYTPNDFYEYLKGVEDGMSGNIDLVILPAMTGDSNNEEALKITESEANDDHIIVVVAKIVNKQGDTLKFFNEKLEVKVITSTSAGTVAINDEDAGAAGADVDEDLAFENGELIFNVTLGGTWAADDTIKITIDDDNVGIMSYTVEKNNHFLAKIIADPT